MTEKELRAECIELMAAIDVVYLTALEAGGYPRIRAMLNLRNRDQYPDHVHLYEGHDDDFMVYISTNTSSHKRKDIEANPRIGLYYCRPAEFFGMSLVGDVEIVEDAATKEAVWGDGWEQYYPTTGRPDDPDYTLLRLFPKNVRGWYHSRTFEFALDR
ncbi:pyridoxamine 5'-phosphate oxidase family protein [Candidatus Bipolaricaulota bacterium]|nr:pyridoxamine 5'-phosphate oxidase family protein [Candidatus Bipolaricaulota bacterium]